MSANPKVIDARKVAHQAVTEGVNLKYVEQMRKTIYALADELDALAFWDDRIGRNAHEIANLGDGSAWGIIADALKHYAENRRRVARKRPGVEGALAGFFDTAAKAERLAREAQRLAFQRHLNRGEVEDAVVNSACQNGTHKRCPGTAYVDHRRHPGVFGGPSPHYELCACHCHAGAANSHPVPDARSARAAESR